MSAKSIAPLAVAGAALAAAIAFAPVAAAGNTMECEDTGVSSVCSKTGHAAIVATPNTTSNGNAGYWPFGAGPTPPIWALD